jgi:hypothetical protein
MLFLQELKTATILDVALENPWKKSWISPTMGRSWGKHPWKNEEFHQQWDI